MQDNRSVQTEVNRRQQFVNQSIQLGRISDALIRALAAAVVNSKDDQLRELLAQNGITINAAGEPEKAPPSAPRSGSERDSAMSIAPRDRNGGAVGRWWLPIALIVTSFFVLVAFETGYAIHDREALTEQKRLQEPTVQEGLKLRQQLEALAGKTAQLAAEGNEGAKAVIDQMKRQGVMLAQPKQQ